MKKFFVNVSLTAFCVDPKRGTLVLSYPDRFFPLDGLCEGETSLEVAGRLLVEKVGLSPDWIPLYQVGVTEDDESIFIKYAAKIPFDHTPPTKSLDWTPLHEFSGETLKNLTDILRKF